jgi:hypothetical protein
MSFKLKAFITPGNFRFKVPCGVQSLVIRMWGAGGGGGNASAAGGAGGAFVGFTLKVKEQETLFLTVGQGGDGTLGTSGTDTILQTKKVKGIAGGGVGGAQGTPGQPTNGGLPSLTGISTNGAILIPGARGGVVTSLDGQTGGASSGGGGIGFPLFSPPNLMGEPGQQPGSGGGSPGGDGANGQIEIYFVQDRQARLPLQLCC